MTRARGLIRVLSVFLVAAVAFVLAKIIVDGWDEVVTSYRSIDYRFLAVSFLLGQLNVACLMLLWWGLFRCIDGGGGMPLSQGARIFASAWLGRYLPGRLWTAAGKVYLGRQLGCDLRRLTISVFFELTLSVTAQATVALILILLFFDGVVFGSHYGVSLAGLAVAVVMIAIHPKILWRVVSRLLQRLGRPPIGEDEVLSYPATLGFFLLYGFQVLIMGLGMLSFARALAPLNSENVLFVLASFVVANFIGRIVFVAPVGIGVREGALTALLHFKLSLALASLITVLSRVWLVLVDLSFVALVFLAGRLGRRG